MVPKCVCIFQFASHKNWCTEDAVNTAIHTALSHLESKDRFKLADDSTVTVLITEGYKTASKRVEADPVGTVMEQ